MTRTPGIRLHGLMEKALTFNILNRLVKSLLLTLFMTALCILCAQIRIPLPGTAVPITLQSFAVLLSGALLGASRGALSQAILIGLGAAGFSVFSSGGPGYLALLGPTGGYIVGFVLAAYVSGLLFELKRPKSFFIQSLYLFIGSLFIFVPGLVWLKAFTHATWTQTLAMGLWPFLIGDIVKVLLASSVYYSQQKIRNKN